MGGKGGGGEVGGLRGCYDFTSLFSVNNSWTSSLIQKRVFFERHEERS